MRQLAEVERRSAPTATTWCVTLLALAVMLATTSVRTGTHQAPSVALVAVVLVSCTVLAFRTLRPLLVLAVVVGIEACILVFLSVPELVAARNEGMGAFQPVPLGTMLAAWTVASRTPRRVGWGAAAAAGGVLMVTGLLAHGRPTALTDLVVFYLVMNAAAFGVLQASRRDAAERRVRERERETEEAVMEERLRIARELHDVLAHNLTLVNAQAGVAEYLLATQPQAAAEALRGITEHTGRAIDELRATIGLLRYDGDGEGDGLAGQEGDEPGSPRRPVPGVAVLDDLVAAHRATGAPVEVRSSGAAGQLDQHADLAAYRIVQEALTNAAKHAPGMPVEVSLAWSDAGVRIRVVSTAVPAEQRRPVTPGTGHGLIGMRERALAAGGGLRAGEAADGGFEVVATLPAGRATAGGTSTADAAPTLGTTPTADPTADTQTTTHQARTGPASPASAGPGTTPHHEGLLP